MPCLLQVLSFWHWHFYWHWDDLHQKLLHFYLCLRFLSLSHSVFFFLIHILRDFAQYISRKYFPFLFKFHFTTHYVSKHITRFTFMSIWWGFWGNNTYNVLYNVQSSFLAIYETVMAMMMSKLKKFIIYH